MKQQILALTMCLALTSTVALASGTNTVGEKVVPSSLISAPSTVNVAKPAVSSNIGKPGKQLSITSVDEIKKHFEDRRNQERERLYNDLSLSEEQKIKAKDLDATVKVELAKYRKKIQIEARKLRDLKTKHASMFEMYKQKLELKKAKADAKRYYDSSKKSFEAILTKEQRTKYIAIENAKRKEIQQFKKGRMHCKKECDYPKFKGTYGTKQVEPRKANELVVPEPTVTPTATPEKK